MSNQQKIINTDDQPVQIILTKTARGMYTWRVSIKGDKTPAVLKEIEIADKTLETKYGNHQKK